MPRRTPRPARICVSTCASRTPAPVPGTGTPPLRRATEEEPRRRPDFEPSTPVWATRCASVVRTDVSAIRAPTLSLVYTGNESGAHNRTSGRRWAPCDHVPELDGPRRTARRKEPGGRLLRHRKLANESTGFRNRDHRGSDSTLVIVIMPGDSWTACVSLIPTPWRAKTPGEALHHQSGPRSPSSSTTRRRSKKSHDRLKRLVMP